jgi:hypothetical protein
MMRTWLAVMVVALGGCDLYFGGDDEPDPCNGGGYGADAIYYGEYRDPATGTCTGYGGGYPCDDKCGPCPAAETGAAQPDMGLCYSECTGLSETQCMAADGCYAAFYDDPTADGKRDFEGCWQIAPSGPGTGSCVGLDAYACARHDDCSMLYSYATASGSAKFLQCIPEPAAYCASDYDCGTGSYCDMTNCYPPPGCGPNDVCPAVCYGICVSDSPSCAAVDCGPGYHCEEQCYTDTGDPTLMDWCTTACVPDTSSCSLLDCGPGYECVESCEMSGNGTLWCGATCVPTNTDPGSCYGEVACDALPPACPVGTTPGRNASCWTGYCIPDEDCGPNSPGECYAAVVCDSLPPACPTGTTAGVINGCWSGYCIPQSQCEAQSCETLTTESACNGRWDCTAVYTGTNCTCTPNGCTCQTLSFDRCETAW